MDDNDVLDFVSVGVTSSLLLFPEERQLRFLEVLMVVVVVVDI